MCLPAASSRKPQQSLLKFCRFQVGGRRAAGHRLHAVRPHRRARRHAQAGEGRLNDAAVGRDRDLELLLLMLLLKSSRIDSRFTLAARGWNTEQNCKLAAAARQLSNECNGDVNIFHLQSRIMRAECRRSLPTKTRKIKSDCFLSVNIISTLRGENYLKVQYFFFHSD